MKTTAEIVKRFFEIYEPFTGDELEEAIEKRLLSEFLIEGRAIANFDSGYLMVWSCGKWRKIEKIQSSLIEFIYNEQMYEGEEEIDD